MSKPNEITEAVLRARLTSAYLAAPISLKKIGLLHADVKALIDKLYAGGAFSEFVGVVNEATLAERERCAAIARRKGHAETAALIRSGN